MSKYKYCLFSIFTLFIQGVAFADDPLLSEEFFESPAKEDDSADSSFGENTVDFIEPPPPLPEEKSERPMFKRHSFSGGIGISSGYFALNGTVRSFFSKYFLWENNLFYRRELGTLDDKEYSLEFYGVDSALVAQYQVVKLLTPFIGAGPGIEMWSQMYDELEFDKGNSLNATLFLGTNINMTEHLILQLRHVTKMYLTDQPIKLSDRKTKEDSTVSYFQVYFMVSF